MSELEKHDGQYWVFNKRSEEYQDLAHPLNGQF